MKIPVIPNNKANHFVYGAGIFVVSFAVLAMFDIEGITLALCVTAIVGVLKEGIDKWQNRRAYRRGLQAPHRAEVLDAIATVLGGVVAATPVAIQLG